MPRRFFGSLRAQAMMNEIGTTMTFYSTEPGTLPEDLRSAQRRTLERTEW